jgi:hypothetical protein
VAVDASPPPPHHPLTRRAATIAPSACPHRPCPAAKIGKRLPPPDPRPAPDTSVQAERQTHAPVARGRRVVIQGSLQTECWEAVEGPEREAVCVLAERICFVGSAPSGARARALERRRRASDIALGLSAASGFSEEMWS